MIRHGARNPGKKIIRRAKDRLMQIKFKILDNPSAELCPKEKSLFESWSFNVKEEEEKLLVAEGEDELIELAERMQNRFPHLLPDSYDQNAYFFKHTATTRTLQSAQSFSIGLFGRHKIGRIVYPLALHKDPILRVSK